jgi:hypothetical protein
MRLGVKMDMLYQVMNGRWAQHIIIQKQTVVDVVGVVLGMVVLVLLVVLLLVEVNEFIYLFIYFSGVYIRELIVEYISFLSYNRFVYHFLSNLI